MKMRTDPAGLRRPVLASLVLGTLAPLALAQQATPQTPNAGSILQQSQPTTPPAPSPRGPGVRIEQQGGGDAPASSPFRVVKLQITGNMVFDGTVLYNLVKDAEGRTLTLPQLQAYAARITEYYRAQGYPLARAILPAQVIRDGVVTIQVIEARYGSVKLNNPSRVSDKLLQSTLSRLTPGAPVYDPTLNEGLLLLSDVPGVVVSGALKPGSAVGTSDLDVSVAPGPMVTGDAALDNYGNQFTGRARLRGSLNLLNPLRHGDVLSVSAFTTGSRLNYGRLSYDVLLNGYGTHLGASYAQLKYKLGGSLQALQANGDARIGSAWVRHPFVRGRDFNLYGQLQYDNKKLRDHIDTTGIFNDRHLDNWTLSLSGDSRDGVFGGGINSWSVGYTGGKLVIDNAAARVSDAATARTEGRFSKWSVALARLQAINPRNNLYFALSAQSANNNLDSSEKMSLGGAYTVRAYDTGVISGDHAVLGTVEWRHSLGAALGGQWGAVLFADSAHVTVNRTTWAAGTNSANLHGVGLGLNWEGPNRFFAKAYVAKPVGSSPVLVPNRSSSRGWVEVGLRF